MKTFQEVLREKIQKTKKEIKQREEDKGLRVTKELSKYFKSKEMKSIKELLELTGSKIVIIADYLDERHIELVIKTDLSFEYNDVSSGININRNRFPKINEIAAIIEGLRPKWEVSDIISAIRKEAMELNCE
jgi:hypothetical protein